MICIDDTAEYTDRIHAPSQRAGDYILEWSKELKSQASEMFGGKPAATSTLVKRGAKTEAVDDNPSKRMKLEDGASSVEDEVKRFYEKGSIAKVSLEIIFQSHESS